MNSRFLIDEEVFSEPAGACQMRAKTLTALARYRAN